MGDRPHILILMTDQQRADCLHCAGHPLIQTPNLDRIAEEGMRFAEAVTVAPLCMPARRSFASGLYPHNHGMWRNEGELMRLCFSCFSGQVTSRLPSARLTITNTKPAPISGRAKPSCTLAASGTSMKPQVWRQASARLRTSRTIGNAKVCWKNSSKTTWSALTQA
ncbi:MAG: hypothetical protein E6H78_10425 [Betaproteobacteria bacterium]|nr:MAG: hypothetical protein E6H78_10425 [Betaproteobacteria bacterium]